MFVTGVFPDSCGGVIASLLGIAMPAVDMHVAREDADSMRQLRQHGL